MVDKIRQFASAAAAAAVNMTRPNYFESGKKGETYELKNELNSDLAIVRKEAVKKVIASMTIGKDVGALFADVLKNIQTDDLELKKLVYLYLMNYAKSHPELVILAINTFCKDASDKNPLVRALAIRTMGCLRVDKVFDYLLDPLTLCLQDESPYVRKTAAICVAKVAELSPDLALDNGFIDILRDMLSDRNASVVASVVAALVDIHSLNPELEALKIDGRVAPKLLSVLNDCTEWGQMVILDSLATYLPEGGSEEAMASIEKIIPRLQHENNAVVMSAVKVILLYSDLLGDEEVRLSIYRKLAPPLVSMLSSSTPELQFVVLRNINLINQRYPTILENAVRVFFCKFNDPLYVKLEKLTIITQLASEVNVQAVINELAEYAREVDLDFARSSIEAVASVALKGNGFAERCFEVLEKLSLVEGNATMQSMVIALQKMLRAYPQDGVGIEMAISILQGRPLTIFDEDESRAAFVWLLGRYGTLIDFDLAIGLFREIIDSFHAEPSLVQSECLSSLLQLTLCNGQTLEWRHLLHAAIEKGRKMDADLSERCLFYDRLLTSIDPSIIRASSLDSLPLLPPLFLDGQLDEEVLHSLIPNIGTVASIYHRIPVAGETDGGATGTAGYIKRPQPLPDLLQLDDEEEPVSPPKSRHSSTTISPKSPASKSNVVDLLGDL